MKNVVRLPFRFFVCLKNYGLTHTLLLVLHRLRIISVLHAFEFIFKDISSENKIYETSSKITKDGKDIFFREIKEIELDHLNFAEGLYSIDILRMHFSKGLRFFAAFQNNQVIAVYGAHMMYADLVYINMPNLRLSEKVAYLNCAFTAPHYRSLSIGAELRSFLVGCLRTEGIEKIFSVVFIENKRALRWNLQDKFEYWGRISYIKCGNKKFWLRRLTNRGRQFFNLFNRSESFTKSEPVLETMS